MARVAPSHPSRQRGPASTKRFLFLSVLFLPLFVVLVWFANDDSWRDYFAALVHSERSGDPSSAASCPPCRGANEASCAPFAKAANAKEGIAADFNDKSKRPTAEFG